MNIVVTNDSRIPDDLKNDSQIKSITIQQFYTDITSNIGLEVPNKLYINVTYLTKSLYNALSQINDKYRKLIVFYMFSDQKQPDFFIPEEVKIYTFKYPEPKVNDIDSVLSNLLSRNTIIVGGVGCGKTTLSNYFIKLLRTKSYSVDYISLQRENNFIEYTNMKNTTGISEIIRQLNNFRSDMMLRFNEMTKNCVDHINKIPEYKNKYRFLIVDDFDTILRNSNSIEVNKIKEIIRSIFALSSKAGLYVILNIQSKTSEIESIISSGYYNTIYTGPIIKKQSFITQDNIEILNIHKTINQYFMINNINDDHILFTLETKMSN